MARGLAIAFGGGAALGIAHIGVLLELEEAGVVPEIVTGTSSGALVGALYASGLSAKLLLRLSERIRWRHLTRVSFSRKAPIDLAPLARLVNRLVRNRNMEALPLRLGVVAVDLLSGQECVITRGDTGQSVQASCAIPGLFLPVELDNKLLVDGAVLQDVPVRAAREMGAERVVAVSLHHRLTRLEKCDHVVHVTLRSLDIASQARSQYDVESADVCIAPDVASSSPLHLSANQELIRAGREATRVNLEEIKRLCRWGSQVIDRTGPDRVH